MELTPKTFSERLEQLRVLERGHRIMVVETRSENVAMGGFSVDTPADLERAEKFIEEGMGI